MRLDELQETRLQMLCGQMSQVWMLRMGQGVGKDHFLNGCQVKGLGEVPKEIRRRLQALPGGAMMRDKHKEKEKVWG